MVTCESCDTEENVIEIDGHLLCTECAKDVIRCDNCNAFLGINYDAIIDNLGRYDYPALSLPTHQIGLLFCNADCLKEYVNTKMEKC